MKVARSLGCTIALSVAFLSASIPRAATAQVQTKTHLDKAGTPPAEKNNKGIAHVGCVYVLYATIQSTLHACFPDQYPALQRHVDKWLPIMRKFADENARQENQKLEIPEQERAFEKYSRSLDKHSCDLSRPSMEQFSNLFTEDLSRTEQGLQQMLQQSDKPGRNYGCL